MDSTTSLNGYHSFLEDYNSDPNLNPDGFKINNTGPDVALTTESGSFYAAQQVSNYVLYSYDLSDLGMILNIYVGKMVLVLLAL